MPIPRGAIRGVSFDYGHVLGGLDLGELAARLRASGREPRSGAIAAAMPAAYRAHDAAISEGRGHEGAWRALMATLVDAGGTERSIDARDAVVDVLWRAQPTRNLWRYVPDEARALLDDLSAANVRMLVTSNSEGRVRELLEEVSLAHHFVAILDSGLLGFAKPDRRIFEHGAAALGLPLDQILHVGDSEAADIVGARRAGAHALRYDGFVPGSADQATEADARAASYDELRQALWDALALQVVP